MLVKSTVLTNEKVTDTASTQLLSHNAIDPRSQPAEHVRGPHQAWGISAGSTSTIEAMGGGETCRNSADVT